MKPRNRVFRQILKGPIPNQVNFFNLIKAFAILGIAHSFLYADPIKIESLSVGEREVSDEYSEPFLIVTTVQKFNKSVEIMTGLLREKLRVEHLPVKTRFSNDGIPIDAYKVENYKLPNDIFEERQLEAIQECNKEKCLMKLKTSTEVTQLARSKNKKESYKQLVFNRLQNYLTKRELLGYENRKSNQVFVEKMLDLVPLLKSSPNTFGYLKKNLWSEAQDPFQPKNSWLRQEMVVIAPDQMQPILRLSEDMEFLESGKALFLELPIYTNHYFDSSISLYQVMKSQKKPSETVVMITDVMEIDELKKSALIRTLFQGKMAKAISQYQETVLSALDTPKSPN